MEFVDRIEKQKRLQKALNGEKSAFVVVYGRRRLGKSTLIKKVLTSNDVYYIADQTRACASNQPACQRNRYGNTGF